MTAQAHAVPAPLDERRLPPVTLLGMLSLALVAAGVIYLASYLPQRAPLGPAIALLAASAAVVLANYALLARVREFAWRRFLQVAGWTLLAYLVIAGMLEYAFVYDHTHGAVLAVMTGMLAVFTANPPILLAFTVARYQQTETAPNAPSAG